MPSRSRTPEPDRRLTWPPLSLEELLAAIDRRTRQRPFLGRDRRAPEGGR